MTQPPAPPAPADFATAVHCSQCGGTLQPAEGQVFLTCPFCNSTVYLDKRYVVFHWAVGCTLTPPDALAALKRWMAGNATVKDLDQRAQIAAQTFQYFPLWYFRAGTAQQERIYLQPATALSVSEIKQLRLPPGDLQRYTPELDAQAVVPDVTLAAATRWMVESGVPEDQLRERSLVHLPLYTFKYRYGNQTYTAVVDGASGQVFANIFPAKWEVPYLAIAGGGCVLYFLAALIPLIGAGLGGLGLLGGLGVYLLVALLIAVPLFALAAWISAKV